MANWAAKWLRQTPVFFRKASVSFLMRFSGLILQLLGSILVARLLGVEQFGAFTYAATWAIFLGLLLPLGLGDLSVRELPTYITNKKTAALTGYIISAAATVIVTGTIVGFTLWLLEYLNILVMAPGWLLVAVFAIIHGLVLSVSNLLNGFQRILTSQFLETVLRQCLYLSFIGLIVVLGIGLDAQNVFGLMLYAAIAVLAVMLWVLFEAHSKFDPARKAPEFHYKLWMVGALPLFMTTLANRLQLDLGVLMVGGMMDDAETGVFRVAARGAILVSIANMIAIQLVGPMLSRALAKNDREGAQKLLSQAAIVSFATGVPICLALGFGASFYLGLFGPDFVGGSLSLQLLLLGQLAFVLAGPDAILLVMLRKERLVFLLTAVGVALNFGLNYVLIKNFGIEGAAVAALVSTMLIRLTMVTYILRNTEFDTTLARPIRQFLANRSKS